MIKLINHHVYSDVSSYCEDEIVREVTYYIESNERFTIHNAVSKLSELDKVIGSSKIDRIRVRVLGRSLDDPKRFIYEIILGIGED